MEPADVTLVILAGGRSSRYGSDKALAMHDGQAFIAHLVALGTDVGLPIIVAHGTKARRDVLWQALADLPGTTSLCWAADRHEGRGPLEGIRVALDHVRTDALLTAPVDAPTLSIDHVEQLVQCAPSVGRIDGHHRFDIACHPTATLRARLPTADRLAHLCVDARAVDLVGFIDLVVDGRPATSSVQRRVPS